MSHPQIIEAATFPVPHQRLGEDVAAAVVLKEGVDLSVQDLRTYASGRLTNFKVPRRIYKIEVLPKTPAGKVDRRALAEQFGGEYRPRSDGPRSPLEHEILLVWKRLLQRDQIGVRDDFFLLGGDSLLATEMLQDVEALIRHRIPREVLLEASTCRQLTDAIVSDSVFGKKLLIPLVKRSEGVQPLLLVDGDFDGGGYYARHIASAFQDVRGLWLLRPFELGQDGKVPSFEAMAAKYLDLICAEEALKPPYLLAGHCNGALIALEIARQAERRGLEVGLVAMIDPASINARRSIRLLARIRGLVLRLITRSAERAEEDRRSILRAAWVEAETSDSVRSAIRKICLSRPQVERVTTPSERQSQGGATRDVMAEYYSAYLSVMSSYMPRRIKARLVCITPEMSRGKQIFSSAPWRRFSPFFQVESVPGSHLTCLSTDVRALAMKLQQLMLGN